MRKIKIICMFFLAIVFFNFKCVDRVMSKYSMNFFKAVVEDKNDSSAYLLLYIHFPEGYIKKNEEVFVIPILFDAENNILEIDTLCFNHSNSKFEIFKKYPLKKDNLILKIEGHYQKTGGNKVIFPPMVFNKNHNWKPFWYIQ